LKGSVNTLWHFQLQFMTAEMSHVAQLAVFIRDTKDNFQLMEELLQVVLMQEKAGADEFFSHFVCPVNELKLLRGKNGWVCE